MREIDLSPPITFKESSRPVIISDKAKRLPQIRGNRIKPKKSELLGNPESLQPKQEDLRVLEIEIDNNLSIYLSEAKKHELLSPDKEFTLGRRIQDGFKAESLLNQLPPGQTDEQLENQVAKGKAAKSELTEKNLRLVITVARKYTSGTIPLEDLIQEGNLGLFHAVDKFDPDLGYRFTTYAYWWIRQSIQRALNDQGRAIKIPTHMSDFIARMEKSRNILEQSLGRTPTANELAEAMNAPLPKVHLASQAQRKSISFEKIDLNDADIADEGDLVEQVDRNQRREEIDAILKANLSGPEYFILQKRFGFGEDRSYTLEEIGKQLGLSRERVRQIEESAKNNLLRNSSTRQKLKRLLP